MAVENCTSEDDIKQVISQLEPSWKIRKIKLEADND